MSKKITIIGAGPGGYVAALRAAQLGAEVTIIEQEKVGGTCLHHGCIPSKIMKSTADTLDRLKRASELGLAIDGEIRLDLAAMMARKSRVVEGLAQEILKLFRLNKIGCLEGRASIIAPDRVRVVDKRETMTEVVGDSLILALGSRPDGLPGYSFDGRKIISSQEVLNLKEIPQSLLIVGGGVIGCEFAFIFSAFGCEVTVVESLPRVLPLPAIDEDCSKTIGREMKKRKIRFLPGRTVEHIEEEGERMRVTTIPSQVLHEQGGNAPEPVHLIVDQVLVCVGRRPNTDAVGLDRLGVRTDHRGWIEVDEYMQTNVPKVCAIGDALGPRRPMLAHVASAEGLAVSENLLGEKRALAYSLVPGAVFTMPELAYVGLTESQAREQGYQVQASSVLFRHVGKAQAMGEIEGLAKIVSDQKTGGVLGVHIVGPHASDLIAEGVLAMQAGVSVAELARTIHAHPTLSEVIWETTLKALNRPLHG